MTDDLCPHCKVEYPPRPNIHVCADRDRWTDEEREEWRKIAQRRWPGTEQPKPPSTRVMADRGLYAAADKAAQQ